MKLVVDIDKITSNLQILSESIESFSSAITKYNSAKINCSLSEIKTILDSYKESIGEDIKKLDNSSHEFDDLVKECCNEYKSNEENTKTIELDQIDKIISKCKDVTIDYKGHASEKLTGLPTTELLGNNIAAAKAIVEKYKGCNIKDLSNKQFLEYIAAAAQIDYAKSGILPSITIAQAIQESGWGDHAIGNNIFGIKCGSNWTGKRRNCKTSEQSASGKTYSIRADFRDYDTLVEGINDHSKLLNKDRYKSVKAACDKNDAHEACKQISECGYATSHDYAKSLIKLIDTYDLTQYDPKKG